ncbi:MAG: hypothetical protein KIT84_06490 [Labilithrix sp.]|nr:hypothetical protein [Labilithrix sp.]MCW5810641.1 hypothetical protein [Labilithrix sp.]
MKKLSLVALVVLALLLAPSRARAEDAPRATFALIVGSNQSVDTNLAPLRYADDDAARYLDLFRLLGARTYLLTRLDDNTKRLHPQAAAEATDPKKTSWDAAVAQLADDVKKAAERGVETTVYFVYAGHGNVQNGQGYITLEDLRLSGNDLAATFAKVPATRIHVIADACASYFLAYSRGPGGERRALEGSFGIAPALAADARIGLLLSTSSARESHEWDAFQSGVFSHEVRSGLYGAADADGDGQVSYREIAAFVARANQSIPNERYRPDLHARAPKGGDMLLDLRRANGRRIEIDGKHAGHYFLEDARGVRIADVHNAAGQTLTLVRPAPNGRAYLRRVDDDNELVIESRPDVVSVADLVVAAPRVASRGAAHESFNAIFTLPFDKDVVAAYPVVECAETTPMPAYVDKTQLSPRASWRTPAGVVMGVFGAAFVASGVYLSINTANQYERGLQENSQGTIQTWNRDIRDKERIAAAFYVGGGLTLVASAAILFWPSREIKKVPKAVQAVRASALPGGAYFGLGGSF